jgi:hypothetical protein
MACSMCLKLEKEIISLIPSTDEYRRSQAIAEAFNFLLMKYETGSKDFKSKVKELENELERIRGEIRSEKVKFSEIEEFSFRTNKNKEDKIQTLQEINSKLQEKIYELEGCLIEIENKFIEKETTFKRIIHEYKMTFDNFKNENDVSKTRIINLEDQIREMKEKHSLSMREMEDNYNKNLNKSKENEISLSKKLKEYELLMYKMDLENQSFKEKLNFFTSQNNNLNNLGLGRSAESFFKNKNSAGKINLNEEIKEIETNNSINYNSAMTNSKIIFNDNKPIKTEESLILQIDQGYSGNNKISNTNFSNIIQEMNIDELSREIKICENQLKNLSNILKSMESSSENKEEVKDILMQLELKTEYLFDLKKQFNFLYKTLNNINN